MPMDAVYLATTPSQAPPPGIESNFEHPENYIVITRAILGTALAVSTFFVGLRVWSRAYIQKTRGLEDYSMILAWTLNVALVALYIKSTAYGAGVVHMWDVPLSNLLAIVKLANIVGILYQPLTLSTKLSTLLQLIRLFCPYRTGPLYLTLSTLIAFNALSYCAITISIISTCSPGGKIWFPTQNGTCFNAEIITFVSAAINLMTDFANLVLPVWTVFQLPLSVRRKVGVSAVFSAGIMACVSSVWRMVNITHFAARGNDVNFLTQAALWSEVEAMSGIVCGCLPAVPAVFRYVVPKLRSSEDRCDMAAVVQIGQMEKAGREFEAREFNRNSMGGLCHINVVGAV